MTSNKSRIAGLMLASLIFFSFLIIGVYATIPEDYTTFTEVDTASNRIQYTANHIDFDAWRSESTYLYYDYGSAHFTDFVHEVDAKAEFNQNFGFGYCWMLSNAVGNAYAHYVASNDYVGITLYQYPSHLIKLEEINGGSWYGDDISVSANTWYFMRIEKAGTSLTVDLWTNSADRDNNNTGAGSYVGNLSLTLHSDYSFRYLYGCNSWASGIGYHNVIDIENLDINEEVAPNPEVEYTFSSNGVLNVTYANSLELDPAILNGSTESYTAGQWAYLFGSANGSYVFSYFLVNSTQITTNPYNLSVGGNTTVHAVFAESSGDDSLWILFFILFLCALAAAVLQAL